jgi:hypothetical protein
MALAVAEAHRVLQTGGVLLDVHPAARPMRLECWTPRQPGADPARDAAGAFERQVLGDCAASEYEADFAAASAALTAAARQGFGLPTTQPFEYTNVFNSLDDLTEYLDDNDELDLAGDALLELALHALQAAAGPAWLALVQPATVTRLIKRRPAAVDRRPRHRAKLG